jgi:hypothetical protein
MIIAPYHLALIYFDHKMVIRVAGCVHKKTMMTKKCTLIAGRVDRHEDAADIQGFIGSHWMPPSGLVMVATIVSIINGGKQQKR